jgi:Uma2 family endonuclease
LRIESAIRINKPPEAASLLSGEERVMLRHVSWETYESLLEDCQQQNAVRVFYDKGDLEIRSPSLSHEVFNRAISTLIDVIALELEIDVINAGSTTLKMKRKKRGAEPDTCFYIKNEATMRGQTKVDLKTDPPPDLVFEVDITSSSINKFLMYASFGVLELWRYDGRAFHIYRLAGRKYVECAKSIAFPGLTKTLLTDFLKQTQIKGQSAALREFRNHLRKTQPTKKKR